MTRDRRDDRANEKDEQQGGENDGHRIFADRPALREKPEQSRDRDQRAEDRADHDIEGQVALAEFDDLAVNARPRRGDRAMNRSEEHTSELQYLKRISYACLR